MRTEAIRISYSPGLRLCPYSRANHTQRPNACLFVYRDIGRPLFLVGENRADEVHVVDLPTARINRLEQLVHLVITHLLAKVREDISQLTDTDEACHVLVKDLESAAVLFGLAGISEASGAVEDFAEGVEVDCQER